MAKARRFRRFLYIYNRIYIVVVAVIRSGMSHALVMMMMHSLLAWAYNIILAISITSSPIREDNVCRTSLISFVIIFF